MSEGWLGPAVVDGSTFQLGEPQLHANAEVMALLILNARQVTTEAASNPARPNSMSRRGLRFPTKPTKRHTSHRQRIQVVVQTLVAVADAKPPISSLPEHEVGSVGLIVWLATSCVRLLDEFKLR